VFPALVALELQFKNLLFWPWHCQMCNNKNEIRWKGNGNVAELSVGNWKRLLLGNENQWNCVLEYKKCVWL